MINLQQLLSRLIEIDSVNPSLSPGGAGEEKMAVFLGRYFRSLGLKVETQRVAPGRSNVIGILKGSGKGKSLMLNGHTDTVSVQGMNIPAFKPVLSRGRMFGRGSADMKGGLAAQIFAVQTIIEEGFRPKGDVILAMVADEEYASIGTEALVKRYSADAAVICEPTQLDLVLTHKGFSWARVVISGKAAHGSLPEQGVDAIVKAGKFLAEIERLGIKLTAKRHALLKCPSLHASLITGGNELSTYPAECRIELERRTLPGESKTTFQAELKTIVQRLQRQDPDFKARAEVFFSREPLEVSRKERIVTEISGAFSAVSGRKPVFAGLSGWGDSQLLCAAGIPTVIFGPKGEGFHGKREYVSMRSVQTVAHVLVETIRRFCG